MFPFPSQACCHALKNALFHVKQCKCLRCGLFHNKQGTTCAAAHGATKAHVAERVLYRAFSCSCSCFFLFLRVFCVLGKECLRIDGCAGVLAVAHGKNVSGGGQFLPNPKKRLFSAQKWKIFPLRGYFKVFLCLRRVKFAKHMLRSREQNLQF